MREPLGRALARELRQVLRGRLAIGNPIVVRELLTLLRQPRAAVLLALALGVSAIPVLVAWPRQVEGITGQGAVSREIFRLFGYAQMLVLALVAPGMLAASVTSEKEKDTIDLLLSTPLRGEEIVAGKLLGGLAYMFLLGLASIPVLMLCAVLGGLGGADVLRLYGVLALQGLCYGLTSLCCSALSRRTVAAAMVSYLLVACEAAVLVPAAGKLEHTALVAIPIVLVTYLLSCRLVRRPYNPVPKPPPAPPDPRKTTGLVLRPDAFPDKLLLPPPRRGCLEDGVNPIHHKELSAGIHGSGSGFVRAVIQLGMVLGLVAFLVSLARFMNQDSYNTQQAAAGYYLFAFVAAYAMTLGPALGARAFSGEREQGTAEMLCMILMRPREIVSGKYRAYLRVVLTLGALNCVPFVAFSFFTASYLQLLVLALILVSTSALSIALGFWASLTATTTISAMLRSYLLMFGVWVLPALAAGAAFRQVPAPVAAGLRLLSPFYAADVGWSRRQGFPTLGMALLVAHVGLSLLATFWLLRSCAEGFDDAMRGASER
ncbi:MAG: ABC transporter permease subunit [Planctomycetota bacterium]